MNRDIARQITVVVATTATLVVNVLANALPINGQTSAEISNRVPLLIVPANYVFSIWGLIYTLLIGYTFYQALPANREKPLMRRTGWLFVLSCIANVSWLLLFHYEFFPLTMVAMGILLALLILIYRRVAGGSEGLSRAETWLVRVPFSVYLGWITVATIVNAAYVLSVSGWNGFGIGEPEWAVIMLVIATVVALLLIARHRDAAYAAVIVWAFVGIAVKQSDIPIVATTASLMAAIVAVGLVTSLKQMQVRATDGRAIGQA